MILAGDVGGTNARFAAFVPEGGSLRRVWARTWPSAAHRGLAEIVALALAEVPGAVEAACIGIAGPVANGRCVATNLPWTVDARELAAILRLGHCGLLNDVEASAHGLAALAPDDSRGIREGREGARGNRALLSVGTGLGEAGLWFDGTSHHPFATEGGHASFSPTDDLMVALWRFLRRTHEHVSWERVLCGAGLLAVHAFLREQQGERERSSDAGGVAAMSSEGVAGPALLDAADAGTDPDAVRTVELFVEMLGVEAGNLTLKTMALGGLYLGGGLGSRLAHWLARPVFLEAFLGKGRLRGLLEGVPVRVLRDGSAALIGAARCALDPARAR